MSDNVSSILQEINQSHLTKDLHFTHVECFCLCDGEVDWHVSAMNTRDTVIHCSCTTSRSRQLVVTELEVCWIKWSKGRWVKTVPCSDGEIWQFVSWKKWKYFWTKMVEIPGKYWRDQSNKMPKQWKLFTECWHDRLPKTNPHTATISPVGDLNGHYGVFLLQIHRPPVTRLVSICVHAGPTEEVCARISIWKK